MLVLTRKLGEKVVIGDDIVVSVVKLDGKRVRLGIDAPSDIRVIRGEAVDRPARSRILIVDDNPIDRVLYRRYLGGAESNFDFSEAECGDQGLEICRQSPPDCILLDFRLPDFDGVEFLDALATEKMGPLAPVVMLTRFGSDDVARAALEKGASRFLLKGDLSDEILREAVVESMLRRAPLN